MADMEHEIARYVDDLTSATAERERIETELKLANRIQSSMLPNEFPPFPNREEINLYASRAPAKEVGGDFYDYFFVDDDLFGVDRTIDALNTAPDQSPEKLNGGFARR